MVQLDREISLILLRREQERGLGLDWVRGEEKWMSKWE